MNANTYSSQNLQTLRVYIEKLGFRENEVIAGISVILIPQITAYLSTHPDKSFEEAMGAVHDSYGTMGFKKIADAVNKTIAREVSQIHNEEKNATFKDGKIMVMLLVITVFFGVVTWLSMKYLPANVGMLTPYFLLGLCLFLPGGIGLFFYGKRLLSDYPVRRRLLHGKTSTGFLLLFIFFLSPKIPTSETAQLLTTLAYSVFFLFYFFSAYTVWRSLRRLKNELHNQNALPEVNVTFA